MRISDWSSDVCSSDLNYALVNIVDELRRIPGVGSVDSFGMKEYAIRIWLQPDRLASAGLTPMDVASAVREQIASRSEERRVGKECVSQCRSRWSPVH